MDRILAKPDGSRVWQIVALDWVLPVPSLGAFQLG